MVGLIRKTIWAVIHCFCKIFKKATSCMRRLRKPPCESVNLTEIGIVSNKEKPADLVTWSSWDDIPVIVTDPGPKPVDPIQLKIEEYRERKMQLQNSEVDSEDVIDFFQDMAPKITRQEKVLIQGVETDENIPHTSLSFAVEPIYPSPELGVWEETERWEDQEPNDWSTFEILRETRTIERSRRIAEHQKKKQERESQPRRSITKLANK